MDHVERFLSFAEVLKYSLPIQRLTCVRSLSLPARAGGSQWSARQLVAQRGALLPPPPLCSPLLPSAARCGRRCCARPRTMCSRRCCWPSLRTLSSSSGRTTQARSASAPHLMERAHTRTHGHARTPALWRRVLWERYAEVTCNSASAHASSHCRGYGQRGLQGLTAAEKEELIAEWEPEPLGACAAGAAPARRKVRSACLLYLPPPLPRPFSPLSRSRGRGLTRTAMGD